MRELFCAVCLVVLPMQLIAQTTAGTPGAQPGTAAGLEEIVVTANKRAVLLETRTLQ
jgi:hypothetical protein